MAADNFNQGGKTTSNNAEYLSVTAGRNYKKMPVAVLTFRPNPDESFAHFNLTITKEQAIRLRDDLNYLFANSGVLAHTDEPPADEPPLPKKPRKPRKK